MNEVYAVSIITMDGNVIEYLKVENFAEYESKLCFNHYDDDKEVYIFVTINLDNVVGYEVEYN